MRRLIPAFVLLILGASPVSADLRIHEWGVWKIRRGEVAHLADLRRESPPFVRQTLPGGWAGGGAVARKPVVFVYTDRPVEVAVEVRFPGGRPWLYYPSVDLEARGPVRSNLAGLGLMAPHDRLSWRVRAVPGRHSTVLPPVAAGHFWNRIRQVPSATLLAPDGTAERFLFYDGPVAFPIAYRVRHLGPDAVLEHPGPTGQTGLVVALGDRWVPVPAMRPGAAVGISRIGWRRPPRPITTEIASRLVAAGLSRAEARSLVETWRPEIDSPRLRAFWLLTRVEYDALLPITIAPRPSELVRVGLVIEDLEP
ncbi:MAG: hypothetical protein HYY06_15700 [Deltaproteobacteria bacterium]|nr:hypothetical protein [Deltaproteobacteria bacterium]